MLAHSDPILRYRVLKILGAGAMGSVELVYDQLSGRKVARKRVRDPSAASILRFKREFRAIEQLRHPNLARLYELGKDEAGLYFTMEVADGVDLRAFCLQGDVPMTLRAVLPQLLDALVFLAARGIVHRDIKPSNVFVSKEGKVKLLDFGVLAELGANNIADRSIAGTLGYMAPEQLCGQPASPASDVYALGAMLFELLAQRPVFQGTRAEVLRGHLDAAAPRLSDIVDSVPPLFDTACASMLAKNPAERPSAHDLAAWFSGTRRRSAQTKCGVQMLVGREALQDELQQALTKRLAVVVLARLSQICMGRCCRHVAAKRGSVQILCTGAWECAT